MGAKMSDPVFEKAKIVVGELQAEISRLREVNAELLAACKMALNAFEKNWCIDWQQLNDAISKAEESNHA
jgi:hypothetical protein